MTEMGNEADLPASRTPPRSTQNSLRKTYRDGVKIWGEKEKGRSSKSLNNLKKHPFLIDGVPKGIRTHTP
jgi:hypothetical protein